MKIAINAPDVYGIGPKFARAERKLCFCNPFMRKIDLVLVLAYGEFFISPSATHFCFMPVGLHFDVLI